MDEKKEPQEEEKENKPESDAPKDNDDGIQSETYKLVEAAKRTEKASEAMKKENDRAERLAIKQQLAGKGVAGSTPKAPIDKAKEASNERVKAVGKATGAKWADDMDPKVDQNAT